VPIYEYSCRACGTMFEAIVRDARDSMTPPCTACKSTDVERQISLFAVDSESTRKANLEAGRRHLRKEQVDKAVADREEIEHHQH
jgi:putative FmdB family regulatory protein